MWSSATPRSFFNVACRVTEICAHLTTVVYSVREQSRLIPPTRFASPALRKRLSSAAPSGQVITQPRGPRTSLAGRGQKRRRFDERGRNGERQALQAEETACRVCIRRLKGGQHNLNDCCAGAQTHDVWTPLKAGRKETDGIRDTRSKCQLTARSRTPNGFMRRTWSPGIAGVKENFRRDSDRNYRAEQQREFRHRRHTNALIPVNGVNVEPSECRENLGCRFFFSIIRVATK